MKFGYISGPVDARRIYHNLIARMHTDLFGTSYLRHLIQVYEDQKREAVIVTTHGNVRYDVQLGRFTILNRPQPGGRSLQYHYRQVRWTYDRLAELESLNVGTTVLTAAQHYWFVTVPFRKRGMKFVNSFHCSIRALGHKKFSPHELFIRLTSKFHLSYSDPTMAISSTIVDELSKEAGAHNRKVLQLIPDYNSEIFKDFSAPPICTAQQDVIHVIYAGRVTRNKGVFDILNIAEELALRNGPKIYFHIHGEGDAYDSLQHAIAISPHGHLLKLYGFTAGGDLKNFYSKADIVIVPTRSVFEEGFAKSVVEGVLALRPVVTSKACPSLQVLFGACIEAEVDNPSSYAEAIWRLANDSELAAAKVSAAAKLRHMFFDPPERYDRRLSQALAMVEAG